ncbi:MAG: PIN domain-containing protein [Cyanobacterium sp.]
MILCDTNILIEFYKNNKEIINQLEKIGVSNLAISAITQSELYFGAINKNELNAIKKNLNFIYSCPINKKISDQFIVLMETYSLSHKLTIPDALIASTALVYQWELYTLNLKDFYYINQLKLYQPELS